MPIITYQDFNLFIQPGRAEKTYTVKLLRSGAGDAAVEFSMSDLQGERDSLSELTRANEAQPNAALRNAHVLNVSDNFVLSDTQPPTLERAQEFGGRLFRSVFKNEIFAALGRSLDQARREGARLRIRLNLTDVPELASLPWEFLYNEKIGHFYSQFVETPIVRYLEIGERIEQLMVEGPLRMLAMVSKPVSGPTSMLQAGSTITTSPSS